ncbi:MAG TPA: polysaccharide biosynthesis C-terminal domain-containing protein [Gaiellaceae bacterium]|nr:polysaccharide biosynthesis C-terminal domain-containing protein [Gaiellaceae bacterium]
MASERYGSRLGARAASLPPAATDAIRGDPADDLAPPVEPNLVRPREIPGARRVGRNTVEILLFRGLSTPLALGLVVLQSRFLEPEGRGAYVVAVLGVTIVSRLLGQLGVAVSNRLRTEGDELRGLVHRALALGIGGGLLAVPAIAAAGAGIGGIDLDVALVAAFALAPNVVWQSVSGVLLGQARVRLWNYVQLGSPVLTLAGMLVLVVALDLGVLGAVTAWLVANVLTAAFALGAARDLWTPVALPRLDPVARSLAVLAAGMGAVHVLNLLSYRIELFILDRHAGLAEIGIYSVAMQAAEAMWLLSAAVANAVTGPAIHDDEPGAVRLVRRAALRALGLTAAVAAVVGLAAPFVLPAILGEAFEGSVRPLLLLLPGIVLYAPVSVLVVYLSVRHGRPRLSVLVSLLGMAVTLGLSLVLIPEHGVSGAAVASALGYAAGGALAWLFFVRVAGRRLG